MILVTGSSGSVGSAVLSELWRLKAQVRGLYRSEKDAAKAPSGVETAIGDFADPASLDRALQGVDTVFLVCSPIPQLVELETNVIDACVRNGGVKRIVLNSAFGAGQYEISFPSWHFAVEQRLKASGLEYAILRPESFMQNMVTYYSGSIRTDHAFYIAGGNAPLAFIDVRDIAAVIAKILTSDGHAGQTYTLTGSEALSYGEVAERISRGIGTKVSYVAISPEQAKQSMLGLGMPEWQVTAMLELGAFYTDGPGAKVTDDVKRILGRDPILFDQFVRDYAESFGAVPAKIQEGQ
jgi:uncharacterized protein YbjT (DUF2867 family)